MTCKNGGGIVLIQDAGSTGAAAGSATEAVVAGVDPAPLKMLEIEVADMLGQTGSEWQLQHLIEVLVVKFSIPTLEPL